MNVFCGKMRKAKETCGKMRKARATFRMLSERNFKTRLKKNRSPSAKREKVLEKAKIALAKKFKIKFQEPKVQEFKCLTAECAR
jgi:hypothetical protein